MARDIEKKIKFEVEIQNENKIKTLQRQLLETVTAIEKLQGRADKKSRNRLTALRRELDFRRQLLSNERAVGKQIEKNTETYRKQLIAIDEQQRATQEKLARQQSSQKFWSQSVWQGSVARNLAGRYSPTVKLGTTLETLQTKARAAAEKRMGLETRQLAIKGELAGWRARKALADEGSDEEALANRQIGRLLAEAKTVKTGISKTGAEEAALGSAAGKVSTTLAVLNATKKVAQAIYKSFSDAFKTVVGMSISIKENFADILNRVSEMTGKSGMASYNTGTSLFTNAAARQTQLQYGLIGGQAYAFDMTRSMLNIKSDEDLLYMNKSQRAVFMQMMQKQTQWYAQLESSGVLRDIQQVQLDIEMFKQEMAVGILQWVSKNKETIMNVVVMTFDVLKALLSVLASIATMFGISYSGSTYGVGSTALSDAVTSGAQSATVNKSVNMTAHLNANGVLSDQEALQTYMEQALENIVRRTSEAMP